MESDNRILFIGEDVLDPYGGAFKASKGLSTKFPEQVYTTPISEGALAGIGAGLSMQGFIPIIEIMFGDFSTLCFDQLVNGISKFPLMYNGKVTCPVIIRTPMGGGRGYGPTHSQSLEKFLVGIPNLLVISPSLYIDPYEIYSSAIADTRPKFIIENKLMYPEFQKNIIDGKVDMFSVKALPGEVLPSLYFSLNNFKKADVSIITYGGMTSLALEVAEKLYLEVEIAAEVIVLHTISHFCSTHFSESIERSKRVLIIEEGTAYQGIGAEMSATIHETFFTVLKAPVTRIASPNGIIPSSKQLEADFLPNKEKLTQAILDLSKS